MCGIVGVLDKTGQTRQANVEAMSRCLAHRGPDDVGIFSDEQSGLFLAQQRLSLIDLSPAGHQPMTIGKHTIVYNGEVYNYEVVRTELASLGVVCEGSSDTEVVLRAWQQWGSEAVQKFRGMFALAIWDSEKQTLTLCRDRVGVKPLYLYHVDDVLIFASELKAILEHPSVERKLNHDALQLFLQLGYVPAPHSIFKDITKVLPGHCVRIDAELSVHSEQYWQLADAYTSAGGDVSETEALAELEKRITESASLRMIADVPVGVFLSGGIDSSLVTAVLKKQGFNNLSTFTIGFGEASHNEATHAKAVAEYLGTKHHELTCTTKDAQDIIPKLPKIFDEPFADASAIPTYLLSQFAKQHVTAALSADGGDEVFGGYTRYQSSNNIYHTFKKLPAGIGWLINAAAFAAQLLVRVKLVHPNRVHKFKKASSFYQHRNSVAASYATQQSYFTNDELQRLLTKPSGTFVTDFLNHFSISGIKNHLRKVQHLDFHTYLPDDIMVKVDRASMAVSLEGREPLLDHTIIEYAASLPDQLLHKELGNKYLLRQLLYTYIPRELVDRPKQGFGVPLNDWLKGDLRHVLDTYLDEAFITKQGIFNPAQVAKEKHDFLSGAQPYNRVWNIIVFQMWYKEYLSDTL